MLAVIVWYLMIPPSPQTDYGAARTEGSALKLGTDRQLRFAETM